MATNKTGKETRVNSQRILVVDDEADLRELLSISLNRMDLQVDTAVGVTEARELLGRNIYTLCITDMRMKDGNGLELVQYITNHHHHLPVAVITAHGSADNAVAALKAGAFDYISKPISPSALRSLVQSVLRLPSVPATVPNGGEERELMGSAPALQEVRSMIDRVARTHAPVYIQGESGTGKELAARRIHALSGRTGSFVAINCGAIPENLMESEFFGVRKGAYTGADRDREGFIQSAWKGTLFLDEVADLPLLMQVKLLRVFQERTVRRLGDTSEQEVDIRVISATHQDLSKLVQKELFRQDLYYRLNVIQINMPSLKECLEDIVPISERILNRINARDKRGLKLSPAAVKRLASYTFPGNVRELENILERAAALSERDVISPDSLRIKDISSLIDTESHLVLSEDPSDTPTEKSERNYVEKRNILSQLQGLSLEEYLNEIERRMINEALIQSRFSRTSAARQLGMSLRSMRYRMERLDIT